MSIRSIFRALIVLSLAAPAVAGCNTIGGVGRDISAVGNMVTEGSSGAGRGVGKALNDSAAATAASDASTAQGTFGTASASSDFLTP